jgi:cellulose synthase/poly-beta-1,6-N-acetylglucosamine synthase-like glycosyltransferase
VEPGSAEEEAAASLRDAFQSREIVVVPCAVGLALNPKISKLLAMEPLARNGNWILSDSESLTDAAFLHAFRREWEGCDVLTARYRFSGIITWPQRLDAAAPLLTLWPGLAVLCTFGKLRLTLGACTGFRRDQLEAIGGWRAFASDLAEDNRLGKELAAADREIRLSEAVVTLDSDPLSWSDYWRHQRRVAVTYRVASPAGFAGAFFTQGVTTSLVLAMILPSRETCLLFAAVLLFRSFAVGQTSKSLAFPMAWLVPTTFVASIVETVCWAMSWFTRSVWWSGKFRRVASDGRFEARTDGVVE